MTVLIKNLCDKICVNFNVLQAKIKGQNRLNCFKYIKVTDLATKLKFEQFLL